MNFFQPPALLFEAMFDPPDDDDLPDTPPVNNAVECYRMLLWLMPACVAVTSMVGGAALLHWYPALSGHWRLLWLGVNLVSTIALGIFRARCEAPSRDGLAPCLDPVDVVIYVVIQIALVPLLIYIFSMALVLTGVLD